jgi:hypothetical protein
MACHPGVSEQNTGLNAGPEKQKSTPIRFYEFRTDAV